MHHRLDVTAEILQIINRDATGKRDALEEVRNVLGVKDR